MDLDFGNLTLAEHKASESPAADNTPEATKVDPLDSDECDGELYLTGQMVVKMPEDPNAEEIASKRHIPFNKVRPKENVVVVVPNAFDPYKFVTYVYKYDPDEDDCYSDDNDRAAFELYRKDFVETQGFDMKHFYNDMFGPLKTLGNMDNTGIIGADCEPTVVMAIKYYNMVRNENLELEKLIKCFYVTGTLYYATFRAKDTVTGAIRTYQAELGRNHFTGRTTIHKFRPKPDPVPEAKTDA